MLRLEFTHKALQDIRRLRKFIAEKNPQAAAKMAKRLNLALSRLQDQPQLGAVLEDVPGLREWVAGDYIARYVVLDERIVIIRIWHGKEDR